MQSSHSSHDVVVELSAPVAAAFQSYGSHSGECAHCFFGKAQTGFDGTRHVVSNAALNFALLKQSLENQLEQLNKALEKAKEVVAEFTMMVVAGRDVLSEADKS